MRRVVVGLLLLVGSLVGPVSFVAELQQTHPAMVGFKLQHRWADVLALFAFLALPGVLVLYSARRYIAQTPLKQRLVVTGGMLLCAAWLFVLAQPGRQKPGLKQGIEFYLTGEPWSFPVVVEEVGHSGSKERGTIGGMRAHSLELPADPGHYLFSVHLLGSNPEHRVPVDVEHDRLTRVNIRVLGVKTAREGLRTITTDVAIAVSVE